jgi:23S rRNA G2445 N2-methylase RlmL
MPTETNIEKRIKKNIYGKCQAVKIIFPPGFSTIVISEIESILKNLWFPKKSENEIIIVENEIVIRQIHMFSIIELLMRSQTITDIRLIIFEGKTFTKTIFEKKCRSIPWEYYFNIAMSVKLKVNSVASQIFHETALKKILSDIITPYVLQIESGEQSNETTGLHADLYRDRLTLSISLAGQPLYKRGYRGVLKSSAPVREDAAACMIQKALGFSNTNKINFIPDTLLIPFSGTGTFAFEFLINYFKCPSVLFNRKYAIEKMPLFRSENFCFLLKKSRENILRQKKNVNIICIDQSEKANASLLENEEKWCHAIKNNNIIKLIQDDFLKIDFSKIIDINTKDIFIPLNPPYGVRLSTQTNIIQLYQNIAKKINELVTFIQKNNATLSGFILCPNEETWSAFLKNIKKAKIDTYHFNQGGMDIRVCQFFI